MSVVFHAITALLASIVAIFGVAKPGATPPPLVAEQGPTGTSGATGALGPTGASSPDTTKVPAYNTSSQNLMPADIPIVAIENSPSLDYATGATGTVLGSESHTNNGRRSGNGPKNK